MLNWTAKTREYAELIRGNVYMVKHVWIYRLVYQATYYRRLPELLSGLKPWSYECDLERRYYLGIHIFGATGRLVKDTVIHNLHIFLKSDKSLLIKSQTAPSSLPDILILSHNNYVVQLSGTILFTDKLLSYWFSNSLVINAVIVWEFTFCNVFIVYIVISMILH